MARLCRHYQLLRQATARSHACRATEFLPQRRKGAKKTQGLRERYASSLRLCVFAGDKAETIAKTINNCRLVDFISCCFSFWAAFGHESRSTLMVGQVFDQSSQAARLW